MKYRKRPIIIEAFRLDGSFDYPGWFTKALVDGTVNPIKGGGEFKGVSIKTLEGEMLATAGDWVIRGVEGELYPCKPEIFAKTYEAVPEAASAR